MSFNRNKSIAKAQKYVQKGRFQDAIAEYEKILEGDPNDIRSLMKIGDLYAKTKDIANAKRKYLKVAYQYAQEGFFLKAVAVYKQILRLDPQAINLYSELAGLYEKLGLTGEAIKNYESAAKAYEEMGDAKKSLDILRRIALINPEEVVYQLRLVEMYIQHNLKNEAKKYSEDIIHQVRMKGDEKNQMRVIQKLADLNLTEKEDICFLCEVYLENGFYSKSLAELQKIFSQHGHDKTVLDLLAVTFSKLNQIEKAKSIYKEIVRSLQKSDPQHADIEYYTRKLNQVSEANVADHSNYIDMGEKITEDNNDELNKRVNDEKIIEEVSTYFEYGLLEKAMSTIEKILESADQSEEIKKRLLAVKKKYLSQKATVEAVENTDVEKNHNRAGQEDDLLNLSFDDDLEDTSSMDEALASELPANDAFERASSYDNPLIDGFSLEFDVNKPEIPEVQEKEITSEMPIEFGAEHDPFDLHEALVEEISKLDDELGSFEKTHHAKLYLEHNEVLAEFKKGVRKVVAQDDYQTYYYLGIAYKEMDMLEDAIEYFNMAAKGKEFFYRSQNLIALCSMQNNQSDQAIAIYTNCLKQLGSNSPDYLGLNYELGKVYYGLGQHKQAKACFDKVYALDPNHRSIDHYMQQFENENSLDNDLDHLSVI